MRKIILFSLLFSVIITAIGCGTIKGLGDDISTVGRWLIKGSDSATKPSSKSSK